MIDPARDDSLIFASNRVTEAGAVGGFLAWLGSLNWIGLLGLLIALAGYLTSLYFQIKRNRREQREHDLRVQGKLGDRRTDDVPVKRERRRQSGKISPKLAAMLGASGLGLLTAAGLITDWESGPKRPTTAYQDIVGVWTICDGITRGVKPGQKATDEQCDEMLYRELLKKDAALKRCGLGNLPPYPYATMLSLAWNNGEDAACGSTAAREMRAGNIAAGCAAVGRFVCVTVPAGTGDKQGPCLNNRLDKKFVPGLDNRRKDEIGVCLRGTS